MLCGSAPHDASFGESPVSLSVLNDAVDRIANAPADSLPIRYRYAEIIGELLLNEEFGARIDSGQIVPVDAGRSRSLRHESNNPYHSMVAAMNTLAEAGWTFVESYQREYEGTTRAYHWVVRRQLGPGE